jgi:hypothetical protein
LQKSSQKRTVTADFCPLSEILAKILENPEKLSFVDDKSILQKVFFVGIEDARILRIKGVKRIVVLVGSSEEGATAISEKFQLAFREYFWKKEDERKKFNGFQFFTSSPENAKRILSIIPNHAKIPKDDPTRVTVCMLSENTNLRWLAKRFIRQISPII